MTNQQFSPEDNSVILPHHASIQEQVEQKLASATATKTATAPAQHPFPPPKASSGNHMGALKWIMLLLVIIIVTSIGLVIMLFANLASEKEKLKTAPVLPNPTIMTTPTTVIEGKTCGGIAGNLPENQCPTGYICKITSSFPDASGTCVKE